VEFQQSRNFWRNRDEDADHNLQHKQHLFTRWDWLAVVIISGLATGALFSLTGIPRAPKIEEE